MPKTILVVDDEQLIIRVMSMGLRRAGYEVITARNGLEGLEAFSENQPDAMIADVDMPKMNGVEMCSKILENYPESPCKFFMSTARPEESLRQWAAESGKIKFFEKPISMRALTKELDSNFSNDDKESE